MPPSVPLQRSLFRRQKAAIAAALPPPSPGFQAYEASYLRSTRRELKTLTERTLFARVRRADVVFVGDHHTLAQAQQSFLRLVREATRAPRPIWLALGGVPARAQPALDDFSKGRLGERGLRRALGLEDEDPFGPWPRLRTLLASARERGLPILALDPPAHSTITLGEGDAFAGGLLARALQRPEHPRLLVLTGQYHVAPAHLPLALLRHAPQARCLSIHQNCEQVYWRLLRSAARPSPRVLELGPEELCWMTATPLACQQSFLDSLDAEEGDRPLGTDTRAELFAMARALGERVGAPVEAGLRRVRILTAADGESLERLRGTTALNLREQGQLENHVLSLESGYFPRARLIYLARRSVNHAAEEVSHFVRHCVVGDAMVAPRPELEAFYARCLEEALGFLGSRILNPARQCWTLGDWNRARRWGPPAGRRAAGQVLAHVKAERQGTVDSERLVPAGSAPEFHVVSHGLGYLLGNAMSAALRSKRLRAPELKALFSHRLEAPREQYLRWVERYGSART